MALNDIFIVRAMILTSFYNQNFLIFHGSISGLFCGNLQMIGEEI